MWNWQLSHDVWWEFLSKDDIMPGQHVRTCLHPPKIMHAKVGQQFAKGFYSHRCAQSASRCKSSQHHDWTENALWPLRCVLYMERIPHVSWALVSPLTRSCDLLHLAYMSCSHGELCSWCNVVLGGSGTSSHLQALKCVVVCSRNDHGKYARVDYDLPDVTGGEAIESAHGGTLPGHVIDTCLTQCSAISEGLL